MIVTKVDGAEKLEKTLRAIYMNTNKSLPDLNKQATILALQSAAKHTEPGAGHSGKISSMPKKYKVRPLDKRKKPDNGHYYGYYSNSGRAGIFRRDSKLKSRLVKKFNLTPIKSSVKMWDKKAGNWRFIPYWEPAFNPKHRKIPRAGAAKAGWLNALKQFGKQADTGDNKGRLSRVVKRKTSISVTNMVRYVGKTSPRSAAIAVQNAEIRMRKSYRRKIDHIIESSKR